MVEMELLLLSEALERLVSLPAKSFITVSRAPKGDV